MQTSSNKFDTFFLATLVFSMAALFCSAAVEAQRNGMTGPVVAKSQPATSTVVVVASTAGTVVR